MKKKMYVLDTNVLLDAPDSILSFKENDVIIPFPVIQELDKHKTDEKERGYMARECIRLLNGLRIDGTLNLFRKIPLNDEGGTLQVVDISIVDETEPKFSLKDDEILHIANRLRLMNKPEEVVLVTNDAAMQIKADMFNLKTENYKTDMAKEETLHYTGRFSLYAPEDFINKLYKDDKVYLDSLQKFNVDVWDELDIAENAYLTLVDLCNPSHTALCRYSDGRLTHLRYEKETCFGIHPKNVGQTFLQEALLLPPEEAPLVIIKGRAGTAKTFYSLAAGLECVCSETKEPLYKRILISRPNVTFDSDIGFLPGSEMDKITPLLRFAKDNLEILLAENGSMDTMEDLIYNDIISAEALNFMRGRSITNTYIIIDEAQNMTPAQVKGIITRAGAGTKIILAGDVDQIDTPKLNKRNNGLIYAIDKMKGSKLCHIVSFKDTECIRSDLAIEAGERL